MKRGTAVMAGGLALAAALAGCGSRGAHEAAPAPPVAVHATGPPAPVPAPAGTPVLVLKGALSNRNERDAVAFDLRTLEAMATATTATYEPFVKRSMTFTGVPMADLLERAGIAPGATTVHLHALDDYQVDLRVADLADRRVLLATKADGKPIPISRGGPIRLVFPPDSTVGRNQDLWIWSVDSMTVA
jgi:hypothetical protein